MPRVEIPKNAHYSKWAFLRFLPWVGKNFRKKGVLTFHRRVKFDASCIYNSPLYNQEDVNKLFGVTFGFFPGIKNTPIEPLPDIGDNPNKSEWVGPGHYDSARFGWVWSEKHQAIKLLAYCYRQGHKNWDEQLRFPEICKIKLDMEYDLYLEVTPWSVFLTVRVPMFHKEDVGPVLGQVAVSFPDETTRWGWILGFYFGGHLKTPHKMWIEMRKLFSDLW